MDRFDKENSSVFLHNGYLEAADGVYFGGDFTISVWIKPVTIITSYQRVIDFGCGAHCDNIIIALTSTINQAFVSIYQGSSFSDYIRSNIEITLNQWHHLAFTMKNQNAIFYINGSVAANQTTLNNVVARSVTRDENYLGKSNWAGDAQYVDCHFDDLMFFNRSLTQQEILILFHI